MDITSTIIIVCTGLLTFISNIVCEVSVVVTSPVNPVEEAAILSIHCQVWDLDSVEHEISIQKITNGVSNRLSLQGDVLPSVEERVFLAQRHRSDGSIIYFLSIIDVERKDEGMYQCEVRSKVGGQGIVAVDSTNINMLYAPGDAGPDCSPDGPITVTENSLVSFNCSSHVGNPRVSIDWKRAGADLDTKYTQSMQHGGIVYSVLDVRLTRQDHDAVFLCEVTSKAFPNYRKSCHIGPIAIISGHGSVSPQGTIPDDVVRSVAVITQPPLTKPGGKQPGMYPSEDHAIQINCQQQCSFTNSKVLYWILATVVIGFIAVTFLCVSLVLLVKVNRLPSTGSGELDDYHVPIEHRRERIYVDLESRPSKDKVYMGLMLQKPSPGNNNSS